MPIVDGLKADFEGRIMVVSLNANERTNAQLQAQYGLRGHPSFAILDKDTRVVQRLFGPQSKDELHEVLVLVTED